MTVAGLIFSNIHDNEMSEFTGIRTVASVPFGCRYRLIDFPLSYMVNCGISKIGVITHNNYRSLVDHIGTGKDWDLARRSGGIKILPPFITAFSGNTKRTLYNNRLEALAGVRDFIARCTEECILLCDCNGICNIDVKELLELHEKSRAKITVVSAEQNFSGGVPKDTYEIASDEAGNVTSFTRITSAKGVAEICTNIIVFDRAFLLKAISEAITEGYTDFYGGIICKNLGKLTVKKYKYDGTYMLISSLPTYFAASMKLLEENVRGDIFENTARPIYTKVRNSPPTLYLPSSQVSSSYIADGCVIEGSVENSILFRGVKVGRGSVIKNSILLQDTDVGEGVSLNCVITDKNVTVRGGRVLSGHESIPFFLSKGTEV